LRFDGTAYRAHDPHWSFKPLSGDGAAIQGARFNPRGVPALYLALDPMTAIKEANQAFANKINPCVICSYEVDCDHLADLRSEAGRLEVGTSEEILAAAWFSFLAARKEPPQWDLVRRLARPGVAGILVPSFVEGARPTDQNLVLWDWSPVLPHKVAVFDPTGRLPKNQLSWE
jgi:RES domain-containing protein